MHMIQCIESNAYNSMHIIQYIEYNPYNTMHIIQCIEYIHRIQCLEYDPNSVSNRKTTSILWQMEDDLNIFILLFYLY